VGSARRNNSPFWDSPFMPRRQGSGPKANGAGLADSHKTMGAGRFGLSIAPQPLVFNKKRSAPSLKGLPNSAFKGVMKATTYSSCFV
jgi:hypothetical protein